MPPRLSLCLTLLLCACEPPRQVFDTTPIGNLELAAPTLVSQQPEDNEDPTLIMGQDRQFYVVWSAKQGRAANLLMRTSRHSKVWSDERCIADGPGENFYPSLVQSRDGAFHLAWFRLERTAGRRDIFYANSPDGRTWSRPTVITKEGKDWAPTLYADAIGVLWIVWSSGRSNNRDLFTVRSDDNGRRWSAPQQITKSPEEDDFPHALANPQGDRILVWTRYRAGSTLTNYFKDGSSEIVMANSGDGMSWSAPQVISPADAENRSERHTYTQRRRTR